MPLLKKIKYFILNIILIMPILPMTAYALKNPLGENVTFMDLVSKITDIMLAIGIPVAGLFLVYAGFLFVTARGSEDQLNKAKTTLYWTVIGTAVLVGAKTIALALQETITSLKS